MNEKSIILFDGVCNVCNGFVNFLIPRDKKNKFLFGSLQSPAAQELLKKSDHSPQDLTTVILLEEGQFFTQSTAVLKIFRNMSGLWPWMYGFIIIPRPLRDAVYALIAKNRYRIFGKKDACMIPTPALKAKFL